MPLIFQPALADSCQSPHQLGEEFGFAFESFCEACRIEPHENLVDVAGGDLHSSFFDGLACGSFDRFDGDLAEFRHVSNALLLVEPVLMAAASPADEMVL